MIRKRKMNTIVNITGITLKCLGTSDENAIKKAKKKEYNKQWYLKNKQLKKEYDIKYRKEVYNKIRRERRKNDPEYRKKINEARNEYGKRPEQKIKRNKYLKNKLKTDYNYKLIHTIRVRIKDVLRGHSKSDSTINMLGCTINELWKHLESTFKPGMTKENHGLWHVDHIIPCSSFDLSKPEEQAKCFHYSNLQALWAHENLSKGDKFVTFMQHYK
jgi:hypothetical protein